MIVTSSLIFAAILNLPGAFAASDPCPYGSAEEWQSFLESRAAHDQWVATCEDASCDDKYYAYVSTQIQKTFNACATYIASHNEINACTKNMRSFVPVWMRQHDNVSYGFNVNNHTYLARQEESARPAGMMNIPKELVAALPKRANVELAARQNGWRYLTHDSALDGYRTFVFIPDPAGRFDQWMLLNLRNGENQVKNHTPLSLITVQKKDVAGRPLEKTRIFFRDYNVEFTRGRQPRIGLNQENNGKCYSCHPSGVRELIPRHTLVLEAFPVKGEEAKAATKDFAFQRLVEFNKRLRSYGTPDWEGMIDLANHGPLLGSRQGCLDCHNNRTRGALTVFLSHTQLGQKMQHELTMPPDRLAVKLLERKQMSSPQLSAAEEEVLKERRRYHDAQLAEFEKSRFPDLKKWFLETSCSQNSRFLQTQLNAEPIDKDHGG